MRQCPLLVKKYGTLEMSFRLVCRLSCNNAVYFPQSKCALAFSNWRASVTIDYDKQRAKWWVHRIGRNRHSHIERRTLNLSGCWSFRNSDRNGRRLRRLHWNIWASWKRNWIADSWIVRLSSGISRPFDRSSLGENRRTSVGKKSLHCFADREREETLDLLKYFCT